MPGESTRCTSLLAALLALANQAHAGDAPKVDADFLEFLGSDDSDDADWDAFLAVQAATRAREEAQPDGKKVEPAKKAPPAESKKGDS